MISVMNTFQTADITIIQETILHYYCRVKSESVLR